MLFLKNLLSFISAFYIMHRSPTLTIFPTCHLLLLLSFPHKTLSFTFRQLMVKPLFNPFFLDDKRKLHNLVEKERKLWKIRAERENEWEKAQCKSISKKFRKIFNRFEKLPSHCVWFSNKFICQQFSPFSSYFLVLLGEKQLYFEK